MAKKMKELSYKQRKAIHLLLACEQREDEVADYLGISIGTLRKWQKEERFAQKLEERFQQLELVDAKYRRKQNQQLLSSVYDALHKRISANTELHKTNMKSLMGFVKTLGHELRLDTPGEHTSKNKTEHIIDDIIDRYESNKSSEPNLRLIEPPTRLKKEKSHA